jgi:hypothetical protein
MRFRPDATITSAAFDRSGWFYARFTPKAFMGQILGTSGEVVASVMGTGQTRRRP